MGQFHNSGLEHLECHEKTALLAKAAYELTIQARDTYEPGTRGVTDPARLRGINEVMHRLTRRILTLSREGGNDWKEAEFSKHYKKSHRAVAVLTIWYQRLGTPSSNGWARL